MARRRSSVSRRARASRGSLGIARKLGRYRAKRRFERSPEPAGTEPRRRARAGAPIFVVQEHAARRLHYDFRLEIDGVLVSWAVPKGPSPSPHDRRLAVRTEDHPLDYADFEGEIPKGEYGAGSVRLWDRGTWTPEGDPRRALARGRLGFELDGTRLHGRWHLVRTRREDDGKERWLLFRGTDPKRDASTTPAPDVVRLVRRLPVDFRLTNLEKILYPEQGLRKADLVAYLTAVSGRLLPHVADRPLMLLRCPDGRSGPCFYQKHAHAGAPGAVERLELPGKAGASESAMAIHDVPGLVALGQLGALEIHTWMCRSERMDRPDLLVLDVDPDVGLAWERVVEAALELRRRLDALGLHSFPKTTGGKGLHVVAPVKRRAAWDVHAAFARALADRMAEAAPKLYTTNPRKALRKGRIFLDHLRNGRGATAIAPYSPRAREGAPVATPVSWTELERGIDPRELTVYTVLGRAADAGADPWAGFHALRQSITTGARRSLGLGRSSSGS